MLLPDTHEANKKRHNMRFHADKTVQHIKEIQPSCRDSRRFPRRRRFVSKVMTTNYGCKLATSFHVSARNRARSVENMFHLILCKRSGNYFPE